ncbi:putative chloramphenicol acetyltransferase-like domain superfamily [Dioscorea sansibarensis]
MELLSEVVKLIQEAKSGFNAWLSGECETKDKLIMSYEKLIVNDWTKIGLRDVDYGCGEPQSAISVGETLIVPSCLFVNSNPTEKEGVCVKTRCVKKEHLKTFIDEIMNFD